ncbi:peptidylprolyl isomerase [Glycocaulis profundi]|nr:peptidylprolyl isomerase [Glycocaulis profundi]
MAFANAFRSILVLAALGLAAPVVQAQQVEGVAAVVNDEPITTVDVRDRMRLIIFSAGVQPSEEVLIQVQEQALRGLIEESLQIQTAAEFDLVVDTEEVDEALADMAARNGATVAQIQQELDGAGIGIETLRRQIRAEITWQYLVSGRYNSRIRVSDAQIATTLARITESAAEAQYRVAEIYVALPATGSEEAAEQRIETIYTQLSQGAPFPAVAQQFSDAPTSASGGDAGWLTAEQLRPQVAQNVRQMQPGQISNPIRVSGGYMIVALIDARDGQVSEQFTLQQITVPASRVTDATRGQLEQARGRIQGCQNLSSATEGVEGAVTTDLGSIAAGGLIAQIREALAGVEAGQATEVVETAAGLQIFVVCDRQMAGAGIPTTQQIESELRNQQLSLAARRWLRDLRNSATVEVR